MVKLINKLFEAGFRCLLEHVFLVMAASSRTTGIISRFFKRLKCSRLFNKRNFNCFNSRALCLLTPRTRDILFVIYKYCKRKVEVDVCICSLLNRVRLNIATNLRDCSVAIFYLFSKFRGFTYG